MPLPKDTAETRFSVVLPADLREAVIAEKHRMEAGGLTLSMGSVVRRLLWLGLLRADLR